MYQFYSHFQRFGAEAKSMTNTKNTSISFEPSLCQESVMWRAWYFSQAIFLSNSEKVLSRHKMVSIGNYKPFWVGVQYSQIFLICGSAAVPVIAIIICASPAWLCFFWHHTGRSFSNVEARVPSLPPPHLIGSSSSPSSWWSCSRASLSRCRLWLARSETHKQMFIIIQPSVFHRACNHLWHGFATILWRILCLFVVFFGGEFFFF